MVNVVRVLYMFVFLGHWRLIDSVGSLARRLLVDSGRCGDDYRQAISLVSTR